MAGYTYKPQQHPRLPESTGQPSQKFSPLPDDSVGGCHNESRIDRSVVGASAVGTNSTSTATQNIAVYGPTFVLPAPASQSDSAVMAPRYLASAPNSFRYMQTLIARFKRELETNAHFGQLIDALQYYTKRLDRGPIKGLQPKLALANWDAQSIREAIRLKELFAKKLRSHRFSESAQHILAHILGRLENEFTKKIAPMIAQNASREAVRAAIAEGVIDPVFGELDENVLDLHMPEIRGAIYYLTGNCHLKWA